MKRVAIPVANDKLCEHFGACSYFEVFEIKGNGIQNKIFELPDLQTIEAFQNWVEDLGITDVIVNRAEKYIISLFASKKVNLFVGVPLDSTKKILDDYLQGKLESDKNIIQEITN